MSEPVEKVGALVRRLRDRRGLSQGQLASYAKVTRSWLSLLETDQIKRPDREMLERVASVLDVPAATLLAAAGYRVKPAAVTRSRSAAEILSELQAAIRNVPILVPEVEQAVSAGPGGLAEVEYWPYYPSTEERNHDFRKMLIVWLPPIRPTGGTLDYHQSTTA